MKLILTLFGAVVMSAPLGALELNATVPACELRDSKTGIALNLQQYRGKVVYLDFWASWCGPCAESFPFMNQLQQDFQAQGLQIIAVNLDEQRSDAEAFLAQIPAGFTVADDAQKRCPEGFGVETMPTSFLVDRYGKLRHVQHGFRPSERAAIQERVRALLAENPG